MKTRRGCGKQIDFCKNR